MAIFAGADLPGRREFPGARPHQRAGWNRTARHRQKQIDRPPAHLIGVSTPEHNVRVGGGQTQPDHPFPSPTEPHRGFHLIAQRLDHRIHRIARINAQRATDVLTMDKYLDEPRLVTVGTIVIFLIQGYSSRFIETQGTTTIQGREGP